MVDDEGADGRQLGKCVGPRTGREARGKLVEHVVTGVMAERHQKRAEKNLSLPEFAQALDKARGGVNEHVVAAALAQRALKTYERGLALRAAVARERNNATLACGQRIVQRGSHNGIVPFFREQGRGKAELFKAVCRGTHRCRRITLQTPVRNVRDCHEHASRALQSQLIQHVRKRLTNGPASRARSHDHVGAHGLRELAHERGHARVALLAREATGYDQRVDHPSSKMGQKGSVPF